MIFIAYDYEGRVQSIVCAVSEQVARAYWHGANEIPHSVRCLEKDFEVDIWAQGITPKATHPTGVFSILNTDVVSINSSHTGKEIRKVSK